MEPAIPATLTSPLPRPHSERRTGSRFVDSDRLPDRRCPRSGPLPRFFSGRFPVGARSVMDCSCWLTALRSPKIVSEDWERRSPRSSALPSKSDRAASSASPRAVISLPMGVNWMEGSSARVFTISWNASGTFSQSREGVVEGVSGVSEGVYHPIQINPGIL